MKDKINIVFVTDNNYFKHMTIAIKSIIDNTVHCDKLKFFILDVGISQANKSELIKINEKCSFEFIKIEDKDVSDFDTKTHVSKAAFGKIYMPKLIKAKKVIYLDCDLVVNDDIYKLWKLIEEDVVIKSVWNPFYDYDNKYLGIENNKKTFNSGVMLLNLDLMRKNNSSEHLKDFICKYNNKTKLHDQAAFNAVFKDDWEELELVWNVQVSMLVNHYKKLDITKEEYRKIYNKPSIIHFTSNSKPWQFRNNHPYKYLYKNIYENIYKKIEYKDVNLISILKKIKEFFRYRYYYILNLI